MIKLLNYFFQSLIIYFFFLVGRILGLNLSRNLFGSIFSFFGPLFRSKKIIDKNLETFFIKADNYNKQKIISEMWRNFGMTFIEYIFLNKFNKNNSHIIINGEENLDYILKNNKPVIFVSGHFANFELMSMEIVKKKIKLATIYRPLNNIFLNPLMEFLRKKYICKNQIKKGINGVRDVISYIKKDYSIALMIDQRVSEGEKLSFFGKDASTTTLPAQLSIKFNLDIIPVFIERTKKNNFVIQIQKPIKNNKLKNKLELSQYLNTVLEKMIVKNPHQWIWSHNRWK